MEEKNKIPISEKAKILLANIELLREEAKKKGMDFSAPSEDEILKKLKSKKTPFIIGEWYTPSAARGGIINYGVTIHNPDPVTWFHIYCHVFIGLACFVEDVSDALLAVDPRFARLTNSDLAIGIQPGATKAPIFSLPVPANVEGTTYFGNCFLLNLGTFTGVGKCIDRAKFVFAVT